VTCDRIAKVIVESRAPLGTAPGEHALA